MQTANLAARTIRQSESGLVWTEVLSGTTGTILLQQYQTFRVRATGATTVTIEGTLAATLSAGEIMIFNAGNSVTDPKTVSVVIGVAGAFVQTARAVDTPV